MLEARTCAPSNKASITSRCALGLQRYLIDRDDHCYICTIFRPGLPNVSRIVRIRKAQHDSIASVE